MSREHLVRFYGPPPALSSTQSTEWLRIGAWATWFALVVLRVQVPKRLATGAWRIRLELSATDRPAARTIWLFSCARSLRSLWGLQWAFVNLTQKALHLQSNSARYPPSSRAPQHQHSPPAIPASLNLLPTDAHCLHPAAPLDDRFPPATCPSLALTATATAPILHALPPLQTTQHDSTPRLGARPQPLRGSSPLRVLLSAILSSPLRSLLAPANNRRKPSSLPTALSPRPHSS